MSNRPTNAYEATEMIAAMLTNVSFTLSQVKEIAEEYNIEFEWSAEEAIDKLAQDNHNCWSESSKYC